jgi:prolyl oligopeptidase PreP (S9A serine peptidase family)
LDDLEVAYATESFTEPRSWWRASGQSAHRTALVTKTPLDFSGFGVRREFATSVDGTQVPVTLIAPQGTPRDGSNGGLLIGAVLTQHPGLSRAVVAMVPVMDVLRVELHPNGAFNVTEFGTVQDPELFRAMRAYSPYHNVEDGVAYPAVLLTAGEFDPRVAAYHAKKMAARLQAATSSGQPVLLRVEPGGHGLGNSLDQRVSELADVYAFLFDRVGFDYRPAPDRHRTEG